MTSASHLHKYVIVVASFVNMCLVGSHFSCFSLFYPAIAGSFQSSLGITGWIGSLSQAMVYLPALAYSSLLTKYGCRLLAVTGSLLASIGYITSSFTSTVTQLYFTYGIISGLGMGMMFLPTVVIVQQHFVDRPALASGLSLSGLSIGVVILSAPMQYCITTFSWRGALLIYGGVCLNGLAFSALFTAAIMKTNNKAKTTRFCTSTKFGDRRKEIDCSSISGSSQSRTQSSNNDVLRPLLNSTDSRYGFPQQYSSTESTSAHHATHVDDDDNNSHKTQRTQQQQKDSPAGIISFLKDSTLIFYGLGTFCMNVGMIMFNMHTPNRSLKYGISPSVVAALPTTIALGNITARILFSFVANFSCTNRTMQYALGILMAGLISIAYSFTTTFWSICILCAGEGFFNGAAMTVQPTVLVDLFSVEKLPKSHGALNLFIGIASLLATPFAGFLYDISSDYDIPFIVGGCIEVLGFLLVLFVVFKQKRRNTTTQTNRSSETDIFVKSTSNLVQK